MYLQTPDLPPHGQPHNEQRQYPLTIRPQRDHIPYHWQAQSLLLLNESGQHLKQDRKFLPVHNYHHD